MAYIDFKDLSRRTAADKVLRYNAFNIAKNLKHDRYQRGFSSMVSKLFDKKYSGGVTTLSNKPTIKNENISNKELEKELRKTIIVNSNKRKVHSPSIDTIWCADLEDTRLISKFNQWFEFVLCAIDIIANMHGYKNKKKITIINASQKILD